MILPPLLKRQHCSRPLTYSTVFHLKMKGTSNFLWLDLLTTWLWGAAVGTRRGELVPSLSAFQTVRNTRTDLHAIALAANPTSYCAVLFAEQNTSRMQRIHIHIHVGDKAVCLDKGACCRYGNGGGAALQSNQVHRADLVACIAYAGLGVNQYTKCLNGALFPSYCILLLPPVLSSCPVRLVPNILHPSASSWAPPAGRGGGGIA
jgi:hypothetical protein